MADEQKKGPRGKVEESMQDGIKVRSITLNEGFSSLVDVLSEEERESREEAYQKRLQKLADEDFQRRIAAMDKQIEDDLKQDLGLDDSTDVKPEEEVVPELETSDIPEKLKAITKDDRIAVIGDSIVYGYEVEGSLTWIGKLRREEEINLLNLGVNGDTTGGMLERFYDHVVQIKAKAALIMGGGNDIMGETPLEYVSNNVVVMTQMALDKGIVPIIGVEPEPDHKNVPKEWKTIIDYDRAKENMKQYAAWLRELADQNGFPIIDFDSEMKRRLRAGYGRYFFDGVHPNPAGHSMMANIAKDAFIQMGILKKKKPLDDDRFAL